MLPTFHTDFEHIFVAYISIHLLFCKCSLISSRRKKSTIVTPNILCHKIKPIALIIWLHKNLKLKYLRKKFYWFFIAFWPSVPNVMLMLQWTHCSARYELTIHVCFILFFKKLIFKLQPVEDKKKLV